MYITFASVRRSKLDVLAALSLVFQNIAHNQVAHGHALLRSIHQLGLVNVHNVTGALTPCIELRLSNLIQRVLRNIRDVLIRSLHSCPIAIVFQDLHRSTHNSLCSHFGSVLTTGTQRSNGKFYQAPRLFLGKFQYRNAIYHRNTRLLKLLKNICFQCSIVHLALDDPLTASFLGCQFVDSHARIRCISLLDRSQQSLHFFCFGSNLVDLQIRLPLSEVTSLPFHFTCLEIDGFTTDILLLRREFSTNAFVGCQAISIGTRLEEVLERFLISVTTCRNVCRYPTGSFEIDFTPVVITGPTLFVEHPAAFPTSRNTQATEQRNIEQSNLSAIAMLDIEHILRHARDSTVIESTRPRIVGTDPIVNHGCLKHRIGFCAYNLLSQSFHLLVDEHMRKFLNGILLVYFALLVIRLQVGQDIRLLEYLCTYFVAELHFKACRLAFYCLLFHIDRMVKATFRMSSRR